MRLLLLTTVGLTLAFTEPAFARRDRRESLNFGLGLRVIDASDSSKGRDGAADSAKSNAIQSVTPYLGYVVFEHVNLGVNGLFENNSSEERYVSKDGSQEIRRVSSSTLQGGGFFMRFLFAELMFFEAGLGVYNRKQKIVDEYLQRDEDGNFSGERDEYTLRGIGPGYHFGAGIEVAFIKGFFFTTNFVYRAIQLRDFKGSDGVGKKRSKVENRELNFGISHYLN